MRVKATPRGVSMSKTEGREYVLNVAQQFLQGIKGHANPLTSASWFKEVCDSMGRDTRCFYNNHAHLAEEFLDKFSGKKLQRILSAGRARRDDEPMGATTIPRTSMWAMFPNIDCLIQEGGEKVLRNLAAVALVAAAYDICFCKHHRGGVRPI